MLQEEKLRNERRKSCHFVCDMRIKLILHTYQNTIDLLHNNNKTTKGITATILECDTPTGHVLSTKHLLPKATREITKKTGE